MPPYSDEQLLDYSKKHLLYELQMFDWTAHNLPKDKGLHLSALLESFVVHLRNLIDFFYTEPRKGKDNDDVVARYFFEAPSEWAAGDIPDELDAAKHRANKQVSHLTYARELAKDAEKDWKVSQLYYQVHDVALKFVGEASRRRLHPEVVQFVGSYGEDRNRLLTIAGDVSANTATTYSVPNSIGS
jgi:hypothetical protein